MTLSLGHDGIRHRIKRCDRLLGNQKLSNDRPAIYGAMARLLLQGNNRPAIIVDWSDLRPDRSWQVLRAAIVVKGRAVNRPARPSCRYGGSDLRRTNANRANFQRYQKWPMGSWPNLQPNTPEGSLGMPVVNRGFGLLRLMDHRHHGEICWLPCRIWQQAQGRFSTFNTFFGTMVD